MVTIHGVDFSLADSPPNDGAAVTLSEDTLWNETATLNGQVLVPAGVNLTISEDISVTKGSSIHVNGNLILDGGALLAEDPPSDLQWWSAYGDESTLEVPADSGFFTIEIVSADNYNLSNFTVRWNEGPNEDMDGNHHNISASVIPFGDGGNLTFSTILGEYGELVIDKIVIHRLTTDIEIEVTELEYDGWMLRGGAGFDLSIGVGGTVTMNSSSINGANIASSGKFNATYSTISNSGPIYVSGVNAGISLSNSNMYGSSDDHDILADPVAEISLADVTGTGGIVDLWERQIATQTIQFPGSGITFNLTGVGPQEMTLRGLSMVDGTFVVPANYQQGPRVVEIGYADGTIWTETATISDIEWFTAWGTFYGENGALEQTQNPFIVFSQIATIDVTSVELTKESYLGKRATVEVTLENSGTMTANVAIECYVNDERADISPTYPAEIIPAGDSATIEIRWGHSVTGNATLSCLPLTPSQLAVTGYLGGGSGDSEPFFWQDAPEAESGLSPLLISFLVALVVGLGLVAYFTSVRGSEVSPSLKEVEDFDELNDLDDL